MIELKCEKCGHSYEVTDGDFGTTANCEKCEHVMTVPVSSSRPLGCYIDVTYKADGITPDFDELFRALAKEERDAPTNHD